MTIIGHSLPHGETAACSRMHCQVHHVDEPGEDAYVICYECGHVYRTQDDLIQAHLDWIVDCNKGQPTHRKLPVRWDGEPIDSCPFCSHDF